MEMDPNLIKKILDLAVHIQQIASPTSGEKQRAGFIYDRFRNQGAKDIRIDEHGNVYTRIKGAGKKPPLIVSAHLDTVFPMGTDLKVIKTEGKITGPGIGDNALGLAALFGLYWYFLGYGGENGNTSNLAGDIWLVANVCEEGLGDLKGMKAVVDHFGEKIQAYLVLEGMSLGHIYTRGLGVRRYRVSVHTGGGHSWADYGCPSAIHEIAELITKFTHLSVPSEPRCSMNVGVIHGGTSVNTIAADADLELDLRSENPQELEKLICQVETLVNEAGTKAGGSVRVHADVIGDRPPGEISPDHALVKTAVNCFLQKGIDVVLDVGSTDANVPLSRGYPALCIGLTNGGGAHTLEEYIETAPLSRGFSILVNLIESIYQIDG
jgi:tripeptide aminopeptidase